MTWTKERQKEYMKEYNIKNRKILREKKKIQIWANPEYAASLLQSKKNWQKRNLDKIAAYHRTKRKNDLNFKLKAYMRTRVCNAIRGTTKAHSAIRDLGCSIEEFKIYIEAKFDHKMTWNNYGEWELDHIIPLSKFDLTISEQFIKAAHYTNYQPLWKSDNRKKNKKIALELFGNNLT